MSLQNDFLDMVNGAISSLQTQRSLIAVQGNCKLLSRDSSDTKVLTPAEVATDIKAMAVALQKKAEDVIDNPSSSAW